MKRTFAFFLPRLRVLCLLRENCPQPARNRIEDLSLDDLFTARDAEEFRVAPLGLFLFVLLFVPFLRVGEPLLAGTSLLISSNHFFLCGNRDVSRSLGTRIPGALLPPEVMYDTRPAPVPLTCPARVHWALLLVPFHGEPMNFMGSLMKSFQNSPPSTAGRSYRDLIGQTVFHRGRICGGGSPVFVSSRLYRACHRCATRPLIYPPSSPRPSSL